MGGKKVEALVPVLSILPAIPQHDVTVRIKRHCLAASKHREDIREKKPMHSVRTYGKKTTCILYGINWRNWSVYSFYELN